MKKTIIILFLVFCGSSRLFAQTDLPASAKSNVEIAPDILAKYPGGTDLLYKFFNNNITFKSEDIEASILGELVLTFIVDTNGKISGIELKKGINSHINSEIIRIVKSMPAWIPAQTHGRLVNSRYSIFLLIDAAKLNVAPMFN
ncbi:MAG TPA: hypothetical protein VJY62_00380 [Bacteroidia bacterium]|nr:hypothetical protein [Bacteroidia bacterium]